MSSVKNRPFGLIFVSLIFGLTLILLTFNNCVMGFDSSTNDGYGEINISYLGTDGQLQLKSITYEDRNGYIVIDGDILLGHKDNYLNSETVPLGNNYTKNLTNINPSGSGLQKLSTKVSESPF